MKILLIEPPVSPFDIPTGSFGLPPPHHLERVGSLLVGNHDVRVFDMRLESHIALELAEFQPDLIGISCVAANSHLAKRVLREAKQFNPHIVTVMGGHHPSLYPLGCNEDYVDFVVVGEGELTFQDLVQTLEKRGDPAGVPGIAYRDGEGQFKINTPGQLADLNELPLPARQLTARYRRKKSYFRASWRPTDSIISSRGCPYKCNFCGLWKINQGRHRFRRADLVADELQAIDDPFVCFVDDNTLDFVKNAYRIADVIEERGIHKTYELYGRADTVVKHPALIERWADIGMKLLLIGLETTDQQSLDLMNKKGSVEKNRQAIEICQRNGVEIVAYFIVDPAFDKDDFRRLSDFVAANGLTHPVFTILSPFPGTELYTSVKDQLITDRLDLIDFYHTVMPTRLPLDEFYREFQNLYARAYPATKFLTSLWRDRAVLSPRMLANSLKIKRKMTQLFRHHEMEPAC